MLFLYHINICNFNKYTGMPKVKRRVELPHIRVIEVKGLPDLSNDPFVIKKRQQALETILKYGLPEGFEKEYETIKKNAKK